MERDDEKLLENLNLTKSEQVKNAPQRAGFIPGLPSKEKGVKTLVAFSKIWQDPVRAGFVGMQTVRSTESHTWFNALLLPS